MAHHKKSKKYSQIIQIIIVIITIFLVYTLFQYYERDPPFLIIFARVIGIFLLFALVIFYSITRAFSRFYNVKLLRVKTQVQIKKGNRLFRNHEFLSAYKTFHSLLETEQDLSNNEDLVARIRQCEQRTITQLENKVEGIVSNLIEKIKDFQEKNKYQSIIDIFNNFLNYS